MIKTRKSGAMYTLMHAPNLEGVNYAIQ
ncbi:hypothetical protein VIBNIMADA3020_600025 [Vibrio nigripulchritudo MADA3020]|nr:hypothetical protein VIBNIMADA3020_600025 [Vibrio nigripulchritudo MADA3020]CCN70408.1 hypothetical protein VIBNISFn118_210015 [Vibrio nigripulchritudo SFn118]